jgi:hypothetical protein
MKEVVHGVAAEVRLPPHLAQEKMSTLKTRRSSLSPVEPRCAFDACCTCPPPLPLPRVPPPGSASPLQGAAVRGPWGAARAASWHMAGSVPQRLLGRCARGGQRWRQLGQVEVAQDGALGARRRARRGLRLRRGGRRADHSRDRQREPRGQGAGLRAGRWSGRVRSVARENRGQSTGSPGVASLSYGPGPGNVGCGGLRRACSMEAVSRPRLSSASPRTPSASPG